MNSDLVLSTDSSSQKEEASTSALKSTPILNSQNVLPINKNKPWRQIIRRMVSDGGSGDKNI